MRDKLLAEWFWTDRWMGSSAFLLPIDARGLYREMLTQSWRRGARLPNDHDAIQRAVGVRQDEWDRCWPMIQHYWRVDGSYLVNDTQLAVYQEAKEQQERASERARTAAQARHKHYSSTAQADARAMLAQCPPSPSPSPSLDPDPSPSPSDLKNKLASTLVAANTATSANGNGHKDHDHQARLAMLAAVPTLKGRSDVPRKKRAR